MTPKILALAGSTRTDSLNKKLIKLAAEGARRGGAEVTLIDLRDFPMPLYDGDIQAKEGIPEIAKKLKTMMKEHHGFLISSPEYNSGISGVLKNAIDWTSRSEVGEPPLACYTGKTAGIVSISTGALGGLRGLYQLRQMFSNINVLVLPEQKAIPNGGDAFNPDGTLKNAKDQEAVERVGEKLATLTAKIIG